MRQREGPDDGTCLHRCRWAFRLAETDDAWAGTTRGPDSSIARRVPQWYIEVLPAVGNCLWWRLLSVWLILDMPSKADIDCRIVTHLACGERNRAAILYVVRRIPSAGATHCGGGCRRGTALSRAVSDQRRCFVEVILSAISAGGLVGAGNQYLCLLIVSATAKAGVISLTRPMRFMESWWFIGIVAFFWLLTVAPAYASTLGPGVMNVVNTIVNIVSGFVVPASAALLALASAGAIVAMNPELSDILRGLQLFDVDGEGSIGSGGLLIAGGSALTASALTAGRFLAKPAISASTGTAGTISAPVYATVENLTSIISMALLYVLARIDPWLLVGLTAVIIVLVLAVLAYAVYQLRKLGKGIGRTIRLIEAEPKAGLSVVAEFLVWGSGWMISKRWGRGAAALLLWVLWLAFILLAIPAAVTTLGVAMAAVPPLVILAPMAGTAVAILFIAAGIHFGMRSAGALLRTLDQEQTSKAASTPQGIPA